MTDICTQYDNSYGYVPTQAAGIAFTVLFGSLTLLALFGTIRRKLWFLSFLLGGVLETLGWGARAGASSVSTVCDKNLFIMQITCLIIAPALFSATLYIILGILIQQAPSASLLSAKNYIIVFCTIDFFSLLLQAVGGGLASSGDTQSQTQTGTDIIIAGVFVQIAGMFIFTVLAALFVRRSYKRAANVDSRVLAVLVIGDVLITIRNIYRAVELLEGWTGHINTTESYLIGLDGVMMLLALINLSYLIFLDYQSPELLKRRKVSVVDAEKASTATSSSESA